MAIEAKRGCGYRKIHGLYLVGGMIAVPCDRLPYPLTVCPCCGQGIKVSRGFTRINPLKAFGVHEEVTITTTTSEERPYPEVTSWKENCVDQIRPCFMCDPTEEPAYIMLVGEKYYTPESFMQEAGKLGISKRIPFIPQELEAGKTIIYLAHKKACLKDGNGEADSKGRIKMLQETTGIFSAFIPQRIEKLFWEKELQGSKGEKLKKKLAKQGITPISVPNGDKDHE